MKIGFRTLKTAAGVSLSILIAQSLHLDYFTAAGILTLLCTQKSRKQSAQAAFSRLCACMLALGCASVLFQLLGYYPYVFFLYLLFFIPLTVRLRVQEGIASSSVIVMHVYMHKTVEPGFFLNEIQVILIGLGMALLVNWYMPSIDRELARFKDEVDGLTDAILKQIALYLKEGSTEWGGQELLKLPAVLEKARRMAQLDMENKPLRKDRSYEHYFDIKRQQYEIMERMLPSISRITIQLEQGSRLGEFIDEMNTCLNNHLYDTNLLDKLLAIREYHKLLPLPETREEFENRASLYAVANELERFIATIRSLNA
ncbi:aromatic acid exporter family protein [Gorillibacterium sp. sgz5001074]|uniref:aromatic acid exporter family protein n=1 Tax=Gorillibacterium sp. sgz5001074 TaxID=3446695 RepID=UPI003F66F3FB